MNGGGFLLYLIVATKLFFYYKRVQKVSQFKPPKCALNLFHLWAPTFSNFFAFQPIEIFWGRMGLHFTSECYCYWEVMKVGLEVVTLFFIIFLKFTRIQLWHSKYQNYMWRSILWWWLLRKPNLTQIAHGIISKIKCK